MRANPGANTDLCLPPKITDCILAFKPYFIPVQSDNLSRSPRHGADRPSVGETPAAMMGGEKIPDETAQSVLVNPGRFDQDATQCASP